MNIFEMAKIPLNQAIEAMQLNPGAAAIIAVPERTLEVSIPLKMDDGTTKVFTGYRSQHSTVLGPTFFSQQVKITCLSFILESR